MTLMVYVSSRFAYSCVEGLSPSHNYEFRVIAENLYGRSQPSEPVTLKTVTEQEGRQKKGLAPEGLSLDVILDYL